MPEQVYQVHAECKQKTANKSGWLESAYHVSAHLIQPSDEVSQLVFSVTPTGTHYQSPLMKWLRVEELNLPSLTL